MIKLITQDSELNTDLLRQTWRGRKMYSYYKAYGLTYPFCRFFTVGTGGVMLLFNSTILIVGAAGSDADDLALFIRMHQPFRAEANEPVLTMLSGILTEYQRLHRTTFELQPDPAAQPAEEFVEFNPSLQEVYQILQAGFPNLTEYSLWLTDTSHRCRHGISHVMTYKDSTTATILYDIDSHVLVGEVATLPEARGLGHARIFLKWLAGFLAQFGKQTALYALDIRESFYREIGFHAIEEEYVLEHRKDDQDQIMKGLLDNGNS